MQINDIWMLDDATLICWEWLNSWLTNNYHRNDKPIWEISPHRHSLLRDFALAQWEVYVFAVSKLNLLCISPSCLNTLIRTCKLWGRTCSDRSLSRRHCVCKKEKDFEVISDSVMAQWHRQKTSVRPTFLKRYRYEDCLLNLRIANRGRHRRKQSDIEGRRERGWWTDACKPVCLVWGL